jgi:Cu+-exporting ATPase
VSGTPSPPAEVSGAAGAVPVELAVSGMTCAACARRVERAVNRLDGAWATVNLATHRAVVSWTGGHRPDTDRLVAAVEQAGYQATVIPADAPTCAAGDDGDDEDEAAGWRARTAMVSLPAALVLAMGMVPGLQPASVWMPLLLSAPVALWGAWPFHRAAWSSLRHHTTRMDTLVSLGVLVSFGWAAVIALSTDPAGAGLHQHGAGGAGAAAAASGAHAAHAAEVACALTVTILAGRWMQARARRSAGSALRALAELAAKDATVLLDDGRQWRRAAAELAVGDRVLVRPGEKVPVDAVVVAGSSFVDASLLTGESAPVEVTAGTPVVGGMVNGSGSLILRATRVGADTTLAHITRLVIAAQTGRAQAQQFADRICAVFVPAVLALSAVTLAGWLVAGAGPARAVEVAVSVLLVACPCALGLATPAALLAGTGRGAQLGVLVSGPAALEAVRRIDTVVLDKTGTITTGRLTLADVTAHSGDLTDGRDDAADEALRRAGAVEQASEHPVAHAITAAAGRLDTLPPVSSFRAHPGAGATGTVDGVEVVVGSPALLAAHQMHIAPRLAAAVSGAEATGATAVLVGWRGAARAALTLTDPLRPTSAAAVVRLRAAGLRPLLATGDNPQTARTVADQVGIDDVAAGVSPDGKLDLVRRLQRDGHGVAMVGDGVNDAAALAAADLGIAMGTGADAAIHAGDLTLVRADLHAAADAVDLARRIERTIRQNLAWAFGYNTLMIPLAVAGLLPAWAAGAAMACSSLAVLGNALRLRRYTPHAVRLTTDPQPAAGISGQPATAPRGDITLASPRPSEDAPSSSGLVIGPSR